MTALETKSDPVGTKNDKQSMKKSSESVNVQKFSKNFFQTVLTAIKLKAFNGGQ